VQICRLFVVDHSHTWVEKRSFKKERILSVSSLYLVVRLL